MYTRGLDLTVLGRRSRYRIPSFLECLTSVGCWYRFLSWFTLVLFIASMYIRRRSLARSFVRSPSRGVLWDVVDNLNLDLSLKT